MSLIDITRGLNKGSGLLRLEASRTAQESKELGLKV